MKEVILQIGTHKTGSTSIQQSLAHFDDGKTIYNNFGHSNHSLAMFTLFSKNYQNYHIWKHQGLSLTEIDKKKKDI